MNVESNQDLPTPKESIAEKCDAAAAAATAVVGVSIETPISTTTTTATPTTAGSEGPSASVSATDSASCEPAAEPATELQSAGCHTGGQEQQQQRLPYFYSKQYNSPSGNRTFFNNNWNYQPNPQYHTRYSQRYFEKPNWQRNNSRNNSDSYNSNDRHNYRNKNYYGKRESPKRTDYHRHLRERHFKLETTEEEATEEQQLEKNELPHTKPVNKESNTKENKINKCRVRLKRSEKRSAEEELGKEKQQAEENPSNCKENQRAEESNQQKSQDEQKSTKPDADNKRKRINKRRLSFNDKDKEDNEKPDEPQANKVQQNSPEENSQKEISKRKVLLNTPYPIKILQAAAKEQSTAVELVEEPKTSSLIQVRPLNELLSAEIFNEQLQCDITHTPPVASETTTTTTPPAIQARRHTVCHNGGDNINDRLANMDKAALKYIINNSDTIYDEHLKSQARRRQRDCLRRQLKDIEIEPPKETLQTELVEDDIVDALDLPQLLLQQIEDCLNFNSDETQTQKESTETVEKPNDIEVKTEDQLEEENDIEVKTEEQSEEEMDLMTRLELAKKFKAMTAKKSSKTPKESPTKRKQSESKEPEKLAAKKQISGACIVLSSSSEDEQEEELEETKPIATDDDREAEQVATNEADLQRDAAEVIASFEQHMLPQLKGSLANCYRSNRSANVQSKLHFISCMVTSQQHNPNKFSKRVVAEIQQNLRQSNNRMAIDFLAKEIENLLKLQPTNESTNELNSQQPAHQSNVESAESERVSLPPTPPRNATPPSHVASATTQPLQAAAPLLGMSFLQLDAALPRLSPGLYPLPLENKQLPIGDSVMQNLLEIDRRLLEYQNRRGFLEEMILKFQKEKSDLEMVSLELMNRKYLLLNTIITRNQAAATPPPGVTPVNSPPPMVTTTERATSPMPVKKRSRRTIIVRHVKMLRKHGSRVRGKPRKKDKLEQKSQPKTTEQSSQDSQQIKLESEQVATHAPKRASIDAPEVVPAKRNCQQPLAVIPPLPPLSPPPNFSDPIDNSTDELPLKSMPENSNFIPSGRLFSIKSPISQIVVHKMRIFAASESGDLYVFNAENHKLEQHIVKHSDAITNMFLCEKESCLYTTSLDGFFKKSSLGNLESMLHTGYLKEPLQSIDINWGIAYIGSRWGNIYTYNVAANKLMDTPLLFTGQSIIAIRAIKEGARQIIMFGCKGNTVFLHDAASGLLLRRLSIPEGLNVYSLILSDGHVFCGTQKFEVFKFDFATGNICNISNCGNGAVSMAAYGERFLLVGCYDGFIYVLDKETGLRLGRFKGCGRLVLALAVAGDKVICSSKDNSLEILEIPAEILNPQSK
ncbi:uncharacterized protein LOC117576852 isoform X2 [Drosophila albomicans]|uniref:Uncharacterized protein LOC117576852 isoform X2 n=1 Tax=Drosophila albomicans TaxID=7291 RepID=A0A6P8XMR9_DROAB|nr:uncharacterized protein LOC117576852 isoform X2 [Drosophila albomicans]